MKLPAKLADTAGSKFIVRWEADLKTPIIGTTTDKVAAFKLVETRRDACQAHMDFIKGKTHPPEEWEKPDRGGFVYLVRNIRNGLVKIGFSKHPLRREKTLQSQEPELETLALWSGTMQDERNLHKRFAAHRR